MRVIGKLGPTYPSELERILQLQIPNFRQIRGKM